MPIADALVILTRDLGEIFADRLRSVVSYGRADRARDAATPTLATVEGLTAADLQACAERVASWHAAGLATPLLLSAREFSQSLDAFPFEFGAILDDHAVVFGPDPFDGEHVEPADLRRACEVQMRSHLLHLREGYIEAAGQTNAVVDLVFRSASPLAALLRNLERLNSGLETDDVLTQVVQLDRQSPMSIDQARRLFPAYLLAIEQLTLAVNRWSSR